jgi:translation initiation factor 3 subunit C
LIAGEETTWDHLNQQLADKQKLQNKFLKGADSSDDESEDEDKTVVLSAKDKRFVEMDLAIKNIQNATKHSDGAANDWVLAGSGTSFYRRFSSG